MIFPHYLLTPRILLLGLVVGAATGAMIALLADRFTRRQQPGLIKALLIDAVLGAIGFAGGAVLFASLPVMQKTTTTQAGGMILRTTTRNYQDPYRLAFGAAILPAVAHELLRSRQWRRARASTESKK